MNSPPSAEHCTFCWEEDAPARDGSASCSWIIEIANHKDKRTHAALETSFPHYKRVLIYLQKSKDLFACKRDQTVATRKLSFRNDPKFVDAHYRHSAGSPAVKLSRHNIRTSWMTLNCHSNAFSLCHSAQESSRREETADTKQPMWNK